MTSAARFLRALARQLSTTSLYGPAYPMLARGLAAAFEELQALSATEGSGDVVFEIQADRVLCGGREVTDLGAGPWRTKLRDAGVERLVFDGGMDAPAFERRFHELARELDLYDAAPTEPDDVELETGDVENVRQLAQTDGQSLDEVSDLLYWIHGEIAKTGRLPSTETLRVVESLRGVASRGELALASPRLLVPADGYTTSHCLSVALTAAALAAHLEYDSEELDLVTEAALLHDIGKVRLPLGDTAPDGLTAELRSVMERHPAEGARVLLAGPARHTLAAVVAYEHHMAFQGETGYPVRHYPRSAHRFSRLVQICDAYDVLRSERGFRRALSHEGALEYMRLQASIVFDPDLVTAFADLCSAGPLSRIPDPAASERELATVELSRMPDGAFDADTETPPIRI
jgi:putative nucleotidyltransferase with HDIG domain